MGATDYADLVVCNQALDLVEQETQLIPPFASAVPNF
jgi:hypothetical protein